MVKPSESQIMRRFCSSGIRNRALLAVLYGAGLRITEGLAIKKVDIDFKKNLVAIHNGKGGRVNSHLKCNG